MEYAREALIDICERAIVPEDKWRDRDSCDSQRGVGTAWALLKAQTPFKVLTEGNLVTDDRTIWVAFEMRGFQSFEGGDRDTEIFYLPTPDRIEQSDGADWY